MNLSPYYYQHYLSTNVQNRFHSNRLNGDSRGLDNDQTWCMDILKHHPLLLLLPTALKRQNKLGNSLQQT